MTLGGITKINAVSARKQAKQVLAKVQLGENPAAQKAERRSACSVAELGARYLMEEVIPLKKPRTAELYRSYLKNHVTPELGAKAARDVSKADISRLHRRLGVRSPVNANRVVTMISGMYSWAERLGEIPSGNPVRGIKKFSEKHRERFLSTEEFGRLGEALREAELVGIPWEIDSTKSTAKHAPKPENRRRIVSPSAVAAIRLLVFTGCRLREILNLRWCEVDFEHQALFLPDSKTGQKMVYLPAPAIAVLRGLPRVGTYVIVGQNLQRPRRDLQRPWSAIRALAKLPHVRLHDLRHSFASMGALAGMSLPTLGKLLGHRDVETTQRYAHLADHPMKAAANVIASKIESAMLSPRRSAEDSSVRPQVLVGN
jgi:integrase